MAPALKLSWTPLATGHLHSAWEYLHAQNPSAAAEQIERILNGVEALSQYPEIGRKGRVPGTRELVITGTPFLVAYRVRSKSIQVLAVLHGARRWPEHLP